MECGLCWNEAECGETKYIHKDKIIEAKTMCYCKHCKKAWYHIEYYTFTNWDEKAIKEE